MKKGPPRKPVFGVHFYVPKTSNSNHNDFLEKIGKWNGKSNKTPINRIGIDTGI
jgi:hypothetical protein